MVDFSTLLRKPAGEAKKPPVLPAGDYHGVIKGYELGDNNRNKTPYVRLSLGITDWPSDAPDTWSEADSEGQVREVSRSDVDLAKRQMRRDMYLTEDALWRLDELIRGCGIEANGRGYDEVLPELIGQAVLVEVQQGLNQQENTVFNQVGKVVGQG